MHYLSFPLKIPFPKIFVSTFILRILDVEPETSKGRHNFLLQHETREMGVVAIAIVIQIRGWRRIINLHPELIAFFQVQRRLEGQRTILINGAVILVNNTRPDVIPVQIKMRIKISRRWRFKTRISREWEKISSRSRGHEFPWRQIHGISLVHHRQIERNRSSSCVKWRISLNVEVDGRRFDVGVSDKFLETFSSIIELDNCN